MPKYAFRALPAADMMAYESFKYVTNAEFNEWQRPIRRLFTALNRTKRLAVGYTDKEGILKKRSDW
jgi:hypothetical protein